MKRPVAHHRSSKQKRRPHAVLAKVLITAAIILLGGVITWAILSFMAPSGEPEQPKDTKPTVRVELFELPEWGIAFSLPKSISKSDIDAAAQTEDGSDTPDRYILTTASSREVAQRCGVDDQGLLHISRQTTTPSLAATQYMVGTSKIGEYYYVYELTGVDPANAECDEASRKILESQSRLLEQVVSNVQLKS